MIDLADSLTRFDRTVMSAESSTCPRCGAELVFRDDGTAERCSACAPAGPPPLPRRSRRDDLDFDELPRRRSSHRPPPRKQARAFPFAIVIGVGLGALIVVSLIVTIAIADRKDSPPEPRQVAKST